MHVESQMLKMYAKLLIEMLTNRNDSSESLDRLEIEPELKCILYECLQAEKKTLKKEEERYSNEIKHYIERESRVDASNDDNDLLNEFKELVANQEKIRDEEEKVTRVISRKPKNPQANFKSYEAENQRMGVISEVDLLLGELEKDMAKQKYDKELMKFSQDVGVVKKEKEMKFLTIQGLLDHPYFI